jgi:tRNA(Ile)-lysidine synthase
MALLDALAAVTPEFGMSIGAVHVHHGLSPNADRWAEFCAIECARRGVPLTVRRVTVTGSADTGIEAAARAARYRVFEAMEVDVIALGHHAEDQAETLLLQLFRGAGPRGLAAMATLRASPSGSALLRPFLALPRATIEAYAAARNLAWVEDESNEDTSLKRNYVRSEIAPRLAAAFPGYPGTLARAALHQAEAAVLADDLAALDARAMLVAGGTGGGTLDRGAFAALDERAPYRAGNLLRWFLHRHGLRAPSTARLAAMRRQLAHAADDARVLLAHDGAELGVHRGRIVIHALAIAPFAAAWRGESSLRLPHGTLEFAPQEGVGLSAAAAARMPVVVRSRSGGERIRLAGDRPRQTLKRLLHAAGVPHWQRDSIPLVFCGDALAVIPGIGVDVGFAAASGTPGFEIEWRPDEDMP